jgi:NAD(P)-dependent dehydrogenase (short-subunit alcohol dehydrogenase family)
MTEKPLENKIALVTGTTKGIGRAVALAYAAAGAHVIALGRQAKALESLDDEIKAAGGSATLVEHDLKDFDGIDRLGGAISQRWGKLDILVGNAAILGPITPTGHINPKIWQEIIDVNITANWRLIRSFDPLLRQSDAARVIFVTSGAAHANKPFISGYAMSKAALEVIAKTYASETKDTPMRVNIIDPAQTRTTMRAAYMPGEDPATLKTPDALAPLFLKLASPDLSETGKIFSYNE